MFQPWTQDTRGLQQLHNLHDVTLAWEDIQAFDAHWVILFANSTMAHTNYGELRQLFETFTRVWEAGGQTSLHLHTLDGQARATLDIQLGPPANPRPGAPDVPAGRPGPNHGPQQHQEPNHQRPRRRGPSARARDAARCEAWLQKKEERQQEDPAENVMDIDLTETLESGENVSNAPEVTLESSEANTETDYEHSCDLCEHKSQTKGGLKIHIGRKHKEIPQLDGEIQTERDTDDWWENNSAVSLKTLKVYQDVIEDIKESKLTGEEWMFEMERAIQARMEGCEDKDGVLETIKLNRLKRSERLTAEENH